MTNQDFDKLLADHLSFTKEDIDNTEAGTRKDTRIKRKETSLRDLANKLNKKGL